jgi:hypothetical protein
MSVPEILADFPSLTRAKIESAEAHARAVPFFGKPYPTRTFKHFLRKGTFRRLKKELEKIQT